MGNAGKNVGEVVLKAVCNVVYGFVKFGIENAQGKNENNVPSLSETVRGGENWIDEKGTNATDIRELISEEKEAEEKEAEEKEEEKEDARDITNQQATTARKAARRI